MALPGRITRSSSQHFPCKSINPINLSPPVPSYFFNLKISPLCTKTNLDITSPPPLLEETHLVNHLISLFTKQNSTPNSPDLKILIPNLNTKVVETVLNNLKNWKTAHTFFTWASKQHEYKHNCYTYNAMADILSRARQNAQLRSISMDILNSRCSMTPGALGFFLRCLGSVGLIEEANLMFNQVRAMGLCFPNKYSYNCLIEVLAKSGSVDLVDMRLKEMRNFGLEFDKYTLTPVLKAYCSAGQFEKALSIFNDMDEHGWIDSHVLSILMLSFSKWGEVDKAFELIQRMEDQNYSMNGKTFHVLIHGFVKESRVDIALQLFDKMQKSGFVLDISLYDVLISGLCKNKEMEKAMCLFSEMKESGIHPDVNVLTKLILSCPEERDVIEFLKEREEDVDGKDTVLLYNSALSNLVNNGLIDKAYHLLQAMMGNEFLGNDEVQEIIKALKKVIPNATSFNTVIGGLLRIGKLEVALSLFNDMVQLGFKPNLLLYNNMIDGLCSSDRLEESYKLLREMKEAGLRPTPFTHNAIFGCLCKREDPLQALELVKEMRSLGQEPWIKHSTFLIKQLCKHGRASEACDFLTSMVQEGFLPSIIAYSAAIDGLFKINEVNKALDLFQDISSQGYHLDVVGYNTLINGLCKANRVSQAEDVLNEMVRKGLVPSVVTYNLLIDGWCKNGEMDRASMYLSRMFQEEREPNIVTYTTLIDGLCDAGRCNEAVMLWSEMERKGCEPNRITYMAFINGLCKCDRPNEGLVYFQRMEEEGMEIDGFVYVGLVNAFLSDLNFAMAFEMLKKIIEKGKCPDPLDKNYSSVRDAVFKLCEDGTTCPSVKDLIAKGNIPTIHVSDL